MPTIKEKLYFNFDGQSSRNFKLLNVVTDSGMFEETLVASRELNETSVRGSRKPLLHDIQESPLSFELTLAFDGKWTDTDVDNIIKWLYSGDYYRPLYFEGKEDRIYMCMPVDDASIAHNGLKQGYFTISMRCDSSNLYSPEVLSSVQTVATTVTYTLTNDGHFDGNLEISIKKTGAGKVTIQSLDDGNSIFEIQNLTDQEDIYINCNKEIIETDLIGEYRYDDVIGEFPRFLMGTNRYKVTGACTIQFRYKKLYRF